MTRGHEERPRPPCFPGSGAPVTLSRPIRKSRCPHLPGQTRKQCLRPGSEPARRQVWGWERALVQAEAGPPEPLGRATPSPWETDPPQWHLPARSPGFPPGSPIGHRTAHGSLEDSPPTACFYFLENPPVSAQAPTADKRRTEPSLAGETSFGTRWGSAGVLGGAPLRAAAMRRVAHAGRSAGRSPTRGVSVVTGLRPGRQLRRLQSCPSSQAAGSIPFRADAGINQRTHQ